MIEAAAIDTTMPSPPITASQSQGTSILSRPSTNTCFGISGSARTARASAQSEARRMLSRSIRAGEAKATAKDDVAQISSNSSSRRSAVSRLESSIPLGIRLGSSTTAAATTGPASGPRPASSQPATGQTPRLISALSRRKLGGATAITPLGASAFSMPAFLSVFLAFFLADLSRIMPGWCESARPGATGNPAQFPLFSAPPSPLRGLNHINAPTSAPGVRNRLQMAHSEFLERMNGRCVSRIDQPEQSAAVESIEPKGELRLADFGCDPPAPCPARKDKPDLKIVGSQRVAWRQAGKADDFARGLFHQNRHPREANTEGEESSDELFGSVPCHRRSGKCKAHHIAVAEDQILQSRYIRFDRSAQNQARRRQDDERLLFRYRRGFLVHHAANTAIHRQREAARLYYRGI